MPRPKLTEAQITAFIDWWRLGYDVTPAQRVLAARLRAEGREVPARQSGPKEGRAAHAAEVVANAKGAAAAKVFIRYTHHCGGVCVTIWGPLDKTSEVFCQHCFMQSGTPGRTGFDQARIAARKAAATFTVTRAAVEAHRAAAKDLDISVD